MPGCESIGVQGSEGQTLMKKRKQIIAFSTSWYEGESYWTGSHLALPVPPCG